MWGVAPPSDNRESWQDIHAFIASFPDNDGWSHWKLMGMEVISGLEARGLAPFFRVGQSMQHIIFSTLDHHQLSMEPRLTLELLPAEGLVRIAYSTVNLWFHAPSEEERVTLGNAVPTTMRYLRKLWLDTRPSEALPGVFDAV